MKSIDIVASINYEKEGTRWLYLKRKYIWLQNFSHMVQESRFKKYARPVIKSDEIC